MFLGDTTRSPFIVGSRNIITLRPSCYQCKFARIERVSDITLADFWGIEEATNQWDRTNQKASKSVLRHSEKKIVPLRC